MKIVIPMSGVGRRFIEAGYTEPKPLILADGKPIIEHVVGMFPGEQDFIFVCNEEHLRTTRLPQVLERIAPKGKIIAIAPHKRGPVHAVLQVADLLDDDEPVVVNYCDFSVEWDWPALKAELAANCCDGAVPAYWGFHPHCLGSTNYAYMRHRDQWMLEIQEKKPFTAARMLEPASSGTYYFKRGSSVKKYFTELDQDASQALNGEHYVSLVYNLMVRDGLKVYIPRLPVMLQWGTPEDLEEYQAWSNYFSQDLGLGPKREFEGQILIPMAGAGQRFVDAGHKLAKPLIPVSDEPMILRAAASLPKMKRSIFVARRDQLGQAPIEAVLKEHFGSALTVVPIDKLTAGQASTCLLAEAVLDLGQPLMIGACDNGMVWDEAAFATLIADPEVDAVAWTFRGHPGARRNPQSYGWVRTDAQGWATEVSVKKPISDKPQLDPGIVGAFWFRRADIFVKAAKAMIAADDRVNNEFYADSVINWVLKLGGNAKIFDVKRYLCWGTPEDLQTWDYWCGHFGRTRGQKVGPLA